MKVLMLALVLAQGADLGTTLYGLHQGCSELNPLLMAYSPSMPAMVALKSGSVVIVGALAWGAKRQGLTRQATVILWTGIGVGLAAAAWNVHQWPYC